MRRIYGGRWDRKTLPYPGIIALLDGLAARRLPVAVLSNKPDDLTKAAVARYFGEDRFRAIVGARANVAHKPDPGAALEIATRLESSPAAILYLGDTDTDMRTAVRAGMLPVGALWGFRDAEELLASGARRLVEVPEQVLAILDDAAGAPASRS